MLRSDIQHFLPSMVLENFCLEAGYLMPNFQALGAEGVVHAPVFAFKVTVDSIECVSTGQSKKKAKHSAAHGALLQLLERAKIELKDCPSDLTLEKFKETDIAYDNSVTCSQAEADKSHLKAAYLYLRSLEKDILNYEIPNSYDQNQINSVGKLQEVCMKNKWTPPKYEEINDNQCIGQEKIFTMNCQINIEDDILCEKGEGRSKKEAKRLSALNMLNNLEEKGLFSFVEEPNNLNNRLKKLDYSKEFKPAKVKIDEFLSNIDLELNKSIDEKVFDTLEDESNYISKLNDLAMYIECEVKYTDFLPIDNELLIYSSLVNLIPYHINFPVITGWGQSSESLLKSKNQAALTALTIFKTVRDLGR